MGGCTLVQIKVELTQGRPTIEWGISLLAANADYCVHQLVARIAQLCVTCKMGSFNLSNGQSSTTYRYATWTGCGILKSMKAGKHALAEDMHKPL